MPHQELIRVVQRLSFCRDLPAVFSVLQNSARKLTKADGVTIVLRDGDFCHYAQEDAISPLWKGRRFPLEKCISGWCMLNREPVAIPDVFADARIPHDVYRATFVKSMAMAPIRTENPLGAVGAYWGDTCHVTPEQLDMLQALANAAAVAIANVQLIDSLQEANRRKDDFLAMLAHELRNPLAPLKNSLHLLSISNCDPAVVEQSRLIMTRQVDHMSRLVDDLLDVSRLTRGKVSLHEGKLELNQLVRQTLEDRASALAAGRLQLTTDYSPQPLWISGDSTRLTQVIANLLDNAVKFSDGAGQLHICLASDETNRQAVLRVRDSGIGIAEELLPHVFESFSQADRSLDRTRGGLGLGLAVAHGLVTLHRGTITAHSEGQGRGAEFVIRLPLLQVAPMAAKTPSEPKAQQRRQRVLIVEDNQDSANTLRMLLELYGHEVRLAYDGKEGVTAAQQFQPAVVLCDIGLPLMDGFEVARTLRTMPEAKSARLVAVTGYGREEDRQRAFAAGFDAHLTKPVDMTQLLLQIEPAGNKL
ncbi:Autoinducer 2 sensor kinase/phosphatase LuxQ [Anatilimnocola aggregata]|uniref:histidine kinase n=1 Tax=Anatilimnocola aggregata TaxID=2528021 RepID=A0A517YBF9_9BACT|nr:ATP-binding protein [Anatilimnocola aggregata]QDU27462.1 Autoinducer 2 sensor kinase/phosphatase LuxQ [Anatilimnocola aggregata]